MLSLSIIFDSITCTDNISSGCSIDYARTQYAIYMHLCGDLIAFQILILKNDSIVIHDGNIIKLHSFFCKIQNEQKCKINLSVSPSFIFVREVALFAFTGNEYILFFSHLPLLSFPGLSLPILYSLRLSSCCRLLPSTLCTPLG